MSTTLTEPLDVDEALDRIISVDAEINKAKDIVRKIHNIDEPVLILGETGTGKELFANALHFDRPGNFIPFNCAGGPDTLIESFLFGAKKGSYTGCNEDRRGFIEEAENGTLFLDEIGDMPLTVQAKLLRFLNDRTYYKLGDTKKLTSNARIVCATNKIGLWKSETFRADLYYRISTFKITLPSIRYRELADVGLLVKRYSKLSKQEQEFLTASIIEKIKLPEKEFTNGNIRSILNAIKLTNIMGVNALL